MLSLVLGMLTSAQAEDHDCLKRINGELKTKSETYLFEKHPKVQEVFNLKCVDSDFGNTLYTQDAFVFIHEAAHFEDFNLDASKLDEASHGDPAKALNLYTVNGEHIGNFQAFENLPSIKSLIRPYLEQNKSTFLFEDSVYQRMHDGYIGVDDSMSADIIQGMATELNGYTHGALIQSRVLLKLPASGVIRGENGNPHAILNPFVNLPSQIDGILYFLYNFNLYLKLLKQDHPEIWKEFYTPYNRNYLNKLFTPSIEVLQSLKHCSLIKDYRPVQFYLKELREVELTVLKEVLGKDKLGTLLCSGQSSWDS